MKPTNFNSELSHVQQLLAKLEEQLTTDKQREWLNQALLVLERLNPTRRAPEDHEMEIAYWPCGNWLQDMEDVELMDKVNAFGAPHQRLIVAKGANIDAAVAAALRG